MITDNGTNVGIGTTSPAQKLDVNGYVQVESTNGEGGTIQLDGNNGTKMYVENINGDFRLVNNPWTAEVFRVTQAGNVGIGTTAPAVKLAVGGAGANIYGTDIWTENNIHVQGNETLSQGGR